MTNVVINGLTAVHAGSQGQLLTPDTCRVPGKVCTATTFQNIALSQNSAKTAGTVKVNGSPACNVQSNFQVSQADEAGRCGGVSSGTTQMMAEFITFSQNVLIEGKPAVRQTDQMVSNMKNTPPMPLQQPPAGQPPALSAANADARDPAQQQGKVVVNLHGKDIHMLHPNIALDGEDA
jgi:uncharacterized Zn-binding protein involved in type VI secretion